MPKATKDRRRGLRLVRERAEELARDATAAEAVIDRAWEKAERYGGQLDRLREDFFALMRFARATVSRRYGSVPWASLVTATAAILYFLNPFDLVPDFLIGAGLLDDATVIAVALRSLRGDLRAFQAWERQTGGEADGAKPS